MSTILRYPEDSNRHTSSIIFKINTYSNGKSVFNASGETSPVDSMSTALSGSLSRFRSGAINSVMNTFGAEPVASGTTQEWFPQKKRLETIISLYMPHSVTSEYGASYSEIEDAGGLLGSVLKDVGDGKSLGEIAANAGGGAVRKFASELATVGLSAVTDQARALVGKVTRNIENPRKEIVFEGMSIRRFQFSFDFMPRNHTESETVKAIIKLFKLHMHPEVNNSTSSNGMYLTYPNDFDIEFTYRPDPKLIENEKKETVENQYVNRINTCVLEGLSVEYAAGGQWQTFVTGAPTHIRLNLAFKELEPLTREHIEAGF